MADFNAFLKAVEAGAVELITGSFRDVGAAAKKDVANYLTKSKDDLKRWTDLLVGGQLTHEEFETLVLGKKEVAEMIALKQVGLAEVRLDRFQNALLHLVIESAFKLIA